MYNYQIHTLETAPEKSKPLLELFNHAIGFVPNLAGAVAQLSWIKGHHTFAFGGNISILRTPQNNNFNSFNSASDHSLLVSAAVGSRTDWLISLPFAYCRVGVWRSGLGGAGGSVGEA